MKNNISTKVRYIYNSKFGLENYPSILNNIKLEERYKLINTPGTGFPGS